MICSPLSEVEVQASRHLSSFVIKHTTCTSFFLFLFFFLMCDIGVENIKAKEEEKGGGGGGGREEFFN